MDPNKQSLFGYRYYGRGLGTTGLSIFLLILNYYYLIFLLFNIQLIKHVYSVHQITHGWYLTLGFKSSKMKINYPTTILRKCYSKTSGFDIFWKRWYLPCTSAFMCNFPPYPNKMISIPQGPNKSPRHIVLSHYCTFLCSKWGLMGDLIIPLPRWIKCTIPTWPMGITLMFR
jgi:hypothetical protein